MPTTADAVSIAIGFKAVVEDFPGNATLAVMDQFKRSVSLVLGVAYGNCRNFQLGLNKATDGPGSRRDLLSAPINTTWQFGVGSVVVQSLEMSGAASGPEYALMVL